MRTLTNENVNAAMQLYRELSAATFFRGQTGYGLVVEDGVEKVGEISGSSQIWKPMYFFITGGEKHGRRTIMAEDIKKAVAVFAENELWALLRVTTGKGLRLNNALPELVDIQQAEAGINFELTHFGGRSIVPKLELELSRVLDPAIKWQSGFLYQSQGDKPLAMGQNLALARVLGKEEFESAENFGRVWLDVEKEAKRLMFLHCDSGSLPRSNGQSGDDRARVFLSQELTRLMPRVSIDGQKPGFEYSVRRDGTVMVQKSIRQSDYDSAENFVAAMKTYVAECFRVYTLFCQPLTDEQKRRLGRPDGSENGLIETGDGEFGRDEKRSTETAEQLISWTGRAPSFPFEGWQPEKGKEYFMLQHAWGRGYRLSPGIPRYEERITGKDEKTALRQTVRIEFDGTEKVIKEESVQLQSENRPEETSWSSEFVACSGQTVTVRQTRQVWTGVYRQVVQSNYNSGNTIQWRQQEKLAEQTETREFSLAISGVGVKEKGSWYETKPIGLDLSAYTWIIKIQGKDSDGEDYSSSFSLDWDKLSVEIQAEQEAAYPVCQCGKYRHEAGQAECDHCQNHADCIRCGKIDQFFGKDRKQASATCCSNCRYYEEREVWIHKHLSSDNLQNIRQQATDLVNATPGQTGQYRVFTDGIYQPRFDTATLERLAALPSTGNDLVILFYWIACGRRMNDGQYTDYTENLIESIKARLEKSDNLLANFVRATDKVVAEVGKLREELNGFFNWGTLNISQPHPFSDEEIKQIQSRWSDGSGEPTQQKLEILRSLKSDLVDRVEEYRAGLETKRQAKADRGEIWLDARVPVSTESRCYTDVFCIAPDGEIIAGKEERGEGRKGRLYAYLFGDLSTNHLVISHGHDNYGYRYTEWWRVDYLPQNLTYAQKMQVEELGQNRQYFVGEGTGWDLRQVGKVEFTTDYSRDMTGQDLEAHNEQYNLFPIDVNEYESWQNGRDPHLPSHMVGEPNPKVVVGPYKKKVNQPPVKDTPASGTWTAVDDQKMAKKGWYICPQGHTELIKNAEYGKQYTCGSCDHEYQII